jgi:hypothetical protein
MYPALSGGNGNIFPAAIILIGNLAAKRHFTPFATGPTPILPTKREATLVKPLAMVWFLSVIGWLGSSAVAAEGTKLAFDIYAGYFVSNRFEPDAAQSFVVIHDQQQFDQVFGVAMAMGDKSHRLSKKAFKSKLVLAAIKRGNAVWQFKMDCVTVDQGVVTLRYTTTSKPSDSATFACPLIVSIPKGEYTAVRFVENQKTVKEFSTENGPSSTSPQP